MLIFTTRGLLDREDESAFTRTFTPGATALGFATVNPAAGGSRSVAGLVADATDAEALDALLSLFEGERPLCIYLHGNRNPPASCFARCLLMESRIFGSQRDIEQGEIPRQVYPLGCDGDGLTCYMAAPRVVDGGG